MSICPAIRPRMPVSPPVEVRKLAVRGALTAHGHGVYTYRGVPAKQTRNRHCGGPGR
ncbi:MAG: hypothetical protein LKI24_09600 [Acidipropionibacterium sp.]|nr:hypothetical protein [Acidipropionibacterium sp.]